MKTTDINYLECKEQRILGRYVSPAHLQGYLEFMPASMARQQLGVSVEKRPIEVIGFGSGPTKILMWSQMHGNESTTTKAVLDFLNFLKLNNPLTQSISEKCTLKIIPMLNPDGAVAYTRINANQVDLNRDAQERSQPESRILRDIHDTFAPDFAFNLHDQRTIFNVAQTNQPATVSFLAPAHDDARSVSNTRKTAMRLIVAMNKRLQQLIPGQIARFDDAFNPNCVGDCFQMLHTPTILVEAGHYPEDYDRERTREFVFWALLEALTVIAEAELSHYDWREYLHIPENNKLFFDIMVNNIHVLDTNFEPNSAAGLLYKEVLQEGMVSFELQTTEIGQLRGFFGHKTYDCTVQRDLVFLTQGKNPISRIISK